MESLTKAIKLVFKNLTKTDYLTINWHAGEPLTVAFGRFNPPTLGHGKLLGAAKKAADRSRERHRAAESSKEQQRAAALFF